MQQTIDFTPSVERKEAESLRSVATNVKNFVKDVESVLDSRSDFYSRLMEEDVSWRQALRAGVVLPLMVILGAGCVVTAPMVAVLCMAGAAWVTCRINKADERQSK